MAIPAQLFQRGKGGGVTLEVRVVPRASRVSIEGTAGGVLKVKLTASPTDGQANAQLIELIAKEIGIPKSRISIMRGETARNKLLRLDYDPDS